MPAATAASFNVGVSRAPMRTSRLRSTLFPWPLGIPADSHRFRFLVEKWPAVPLTEKPSVSGQPPAPRQSAQPKRADRRGLVGNVYLSAVVSTGRLPRGRSGVG